MDESCNGRNDWTAIRLRSSPTPHPWALEADPRRVHHGVHADYGVGHGFRAEDLRGGGQDFPRSEEHTSELQSRFDLVCRLLLEKKNNLFKSLFQKNKSKNDERP